MNHESGKVLWRGVLALIIRIWRRMPVLSSIWLGIPLLLGLMIIPGLHAQRDLIDLFVEGIVEREWTEVLSRSWVPLVVFTGITTLRSAFDSIQNMIDVRLKDRASMQIQSEIHERAAHVPLERMDQADYYDRLQRAKMVAGTDLWGILQNVISSLRFIFELFGLMVVVSMVHPVIGILLGIVFAISFGIRLESDIVVRRLNRDLTHSGRQSDYLAEVIAKPETIKEMRIFGSMGYLINKWTEIMRHSLSLRMNARRREIKRGIIVSTVQNVGLFGAIVWLVIQMKSGGVTAGNLVIVFQAMRQAFGISSRLQHPISKIYIQSTKLMDLVEYLREPVREAAYTSTLTDQDRVCPSPDPTGKIVFENVSYRYAGATQPTLHHIQLTLDPGETVALVGENGAGKSTLVRLLLGLYLPTEGRITWDGTDLHKMDRGQLNSRMSAVFQDFVRYETTLRDNIQFGMTDHICDDTTIHRALQVSGATEVERSLGGLDAKIGLVSDGGRELSGGQWQRLAIARAAMRDAQLLVLDEPTAALDPEHEYELYRSFRQLAQGRTVLFVSHRLGWARYADRIVVLKEGRIVEEGSHELLMAVGGHYAFMFRAQAEWYRHAKK